MTRLADPMIHSTGDSLHETVPQGVPPARLQQVQDQYDLLSNREQEVLRGVAYGYTNREIAEHLGISVKSVETYRYRLSDKLEFGGRADLVRFALDLGLLRPELDGLPDS